MQRVIKRSYRMVRGDLSAGYVGQTRFNDEFIDRLLTKNNHPISGMLYKL